MHLYKHPPIMQNRRNFLRSGTLACSGLFLSLWQPLAAWAADWHKNAFEARDSTAAMAALGAQSPGAGKQILLEAPEIAEEGASVRIRVMSTIPGTDWIGVLVDKNPAPLAAQFTLSGSTEPDIETNVKLAQTSSVRAVVRAGGKYFAVAKEVKVAVGGCG